jgi:hypothetical protein
MAQENTNGEYKYGNEIEYQLRISIPYGVQLVAKRAELPMNERAVFDIENRTLKTFVTMPLWNDSIGFLEYVEYRAVSPHETYFRKGIVVELAHPRFPPRTLHRHAASFVSLCWVSNSSRLGALVSC